MIWDAEIDDMGRETSGIILEKCVSDTLPANPSLQTTVYKWRSQLLSSSGGKVSIVLAADTLAAPYRCVQFKDTSPSGRKLINSIALLMHGPYQLQ
jgi:hypothetical protein